VTNNCNIVTSQGVTITNNEAISFYKLIINNKIKVNDRTLNVENLTHIELRNAMEGIDKISFLLSDVLIYPNEKLDMGNNGVYTVKSGDSINRLSGNNSEITKEIILLNPWLFDEKRIKFNYPTKVLIAEGTKIDSHTEHTIHGEHVADFIKDANGGDDIIYGYGGDDEIHGGKGQDIISGGDGNDTLHGGADTTEDNLYGGRDYDTYHTGSNDTITDTDGKGQIHFNGNLLSGTKTLVEGTNGHIYQDDNDNDKYQYILNTPNGVGMLVIKEISTGQYMYVENFDASKVGGYLDIVLDKTQPRDIIVDISNASDVIEGDSGKKYMSFIVKSKQSLEPDESITLNLFIDSDSDVSISDYGSFLNQSKEPISHVELNSSNGRQRVSLIREVA